MFCDINDLYFWDERQVLIMHNSLQERVANLIPSKDLRMAIKESDFCLTDTALLSIVYHCSPDFSSRIAHMRMLAAAFTGELRTYTERIIETQQQMLHAFLQDEPGAVYELHIKETPDSYDETYLCSSFDAAMKLVPMFYQEYNGQENASSRYRVVKRRIFAAKEREAFSEDYLGDADLLSGGVFYSVHMDGYSSEDCEGQICIDCEKYCIHNMEDPYPCFTCHGDAVKYRKDDGAERFGVVLQWDNAPTYECYIIPLDNEHIRYHDFEYAHYGHEHILSVFVERVSVEQLPSGMQTDYLAYKAYLQDHSAWEKM